MSRVKIITDSNSGITQRQGEEMGIGVRWENILVEYNI